MEKSSEYIGLLVTFALALGIAGAMLLLNALLGPKNRQSPVKSEPFECGLPALSAPSGRFSVKFYLVAILFIVFDIEVVFLYPWAINYKQALAEGQGLYMLSIMGFFFALLTLGLFYEWRQGALNWSQKRP